MIVTEELRRDRQPLSGLGRPDAESGHFDSVLEQDTGSAARAELSAFLRSIRLVSPVDGLAPDAARRLADKLARLPAKVREGKLRWLSEALRYAVPQFDRLEWYRDAGGWPGLRGRFTHWPDLERWQEAAGFSSGMLRLLWLLWTL